MKVVGKLLVVGSIGYVLATIPLSASAHSKSSAQKMCSKLDQLALPQVDERLIKNKVALPSIVDGFKSLHAYSFESKSYCGGLRSDEGLVAQEVERIFPKAVIEVQGRKVISESRLLAYVVQAIGELAVKSEQSGGGDGGIDIEALRAELAALSAGVNDLKGEIQSLKSNGQSSAERIAALEAEQAALKARVLRLETLLGLQ